MGYLQACVCAAGAALTQNLLPLLLNFASWGSQISFLKEAVFLVMEAGESLGMSGQGLQEVRSRDELGRTSNWLWLPFHVLLLFFP